jgi:hypothetical protein
LLLLSLALLLNNLLQAGRVLRARGLLSANFLFALGLQKLASRVGQFARLNRWLEHFVVAPLAVLDFLSQPGTLELLVLRCFVVLLKPLRQAAQDVLKLPASTLLGLELRLILAQTPATGTLKFSMSRFDRAHALVDLLDLTA